MTYPAGQCSYVDAAFDFPWCSITASATTFTGAAGANNWDYCSGLCGKRQRNPVIRTTKDLILILCSKTWLFFSDKSIDNDRIRIINKSCSLNLEGWMFELYINKENHYFE